MPSRRREAEPRDCAGSDGLADCRIEAVRNAISLPFEGSGCTTRLGELFRHTLVAGDQ